MSRLLLPYPMRVLADVPAVQARQAVTQTVTTAPTRASVLTSIVPSSQIPAGQAGGNPLSLDYLTQAAQSGIGVLSGIFALLSLIALLGGGYYYLVGKNRWRGHRLNFRLANFWSLVVAGLGLAGVLFMIFRVVGIEGLNARFWLYLLLLVALGFVVYAAFYFRMRYPAELAKYLTTLKPRKAAALAAGAPPARPATAPRAARGTAAPSAPDSTTVVRPSGSAGNPRGTSARGERRREKK